MAKPHKKTIIIVTILSLIINIGELIKPYLIKIVIDDYISLGIFQKGAITIGMIGAVYIGLVILGNIIDFIASTTTNMMGEDIIYSMRNKLFKYTQYASIPFHDRTFLAESIYGAKLIKIFNIQKEKQQECEELTHAFRNSRLPGRNYRRITSSINNYFRKFGNKYYYMGMS